jgi:hypothetical protein
MAEEKVFTLDIHDQQPPTNSPIWLVSELQREVFHADKFNMDMVVAFLSQMMNKVRRNEYLTVDEIQYAASDYLGVCGYLPVVMPLDVNVDKFITVHAITLYYIATVIVNYIPRDYYLSGYKYNGNSVALLFGSLE